MSNKDEGFSIGMFVGIAITTGAVATINESVTPKMWADAQQTCETNQGIYEIDLDLYNYEIRCNNGAEFQRDAVVVQREMEDKTDE